MGRAYHRWTQEDLDKVRTRYNRTKPVTLALASEIGVSPLCVRTMARKLGKAKGHQWTPEEDERLADLIALHPLYKVAPMLKRAEKECRRRLSVLKVSAASRDWYNGIDVQLVLGVGWQWVTRRVQSGALQCIRQASSNTCRSSLHIYKSDLADFIRKYPTEIQGRKVDMVAVVDLLSE